MHPCIGSTAMSVVRDQVPSGPPTIVLSAAAAFDGGALVRLRLRLVGDETSGKGDLVAFTEDEDDAEEVHHALEAAAAKRSLVLRVEAKLPESRHALMDSCSGSRGFVTMICRKER